MFNNNQYCTHCNGFGSSLKDTGDTLCSQCKGTGLRADQVAITAVSDALAVAEWRKQQQENGTDWDHHYGGRG